MLEASGTAGGGGVGGHFDCLDMVDLRENEEWQEVAQACPSYKGHLLGPVKPPAYMINYYVLPH